MMLLKSQHTPRNHFIHLFYTGEESLPWPYHPYQMTFFQYSAVHNSVVHPLQVLMVECIQRCSSV